MPRLRADWLNLLHYAWSIRLLALSLVLDVVEFVVDAMVDDPPIPLRQYLVLSAVIKLAAGIARLFAQAQIGGPHVEA